MRQDLALYPAPVALDGSPCWHLHDPPANVFYQLGWVAFEVLSRWQLGEEHAIVASLMAETTLEIDVDTVKAVAAFLDRHHLFESRSARDSARLWAHVQGRRQHWTKWLLHNYLFFRIPLVRPDAWLQRWAHIVRPALDRRFWWTMLLLAITALGLVARQWETFLHGFSAYQGWQRALAFGVALSLAKVAHELGHALVARYHGCKVPTMGVAFLVMWPVLYTDTNEAWKLPSNHARFQIGIAGMAAETVVAILATWVWWLLPEGAMRAATFFLATTSWLMTLTLNISPFMRFDGYFLLADTLGLPNLHSRAFTCGRWWLRERLYSFGDPPPEMLSPQRQRFMIGFAVGTWVYRFVLFLSIALLVYHFFFKLLGVILFLVEIGWFIVRPLWQELNVWWSRRHGVSWNRVTRRTLLSTLLLLLALLLPWRTEIDAPAILMAMQEQNIYAPLAARVATHPAATLRQVKSGDVLLTLASQDIDQRLLMARLAESRLRSQLEQQAFSESLQGQGDALKRHWEAAVAQVAGLTEEQARLTLRAAFDGEIMMRADDIAPGAWVTSREKLFVVADRRQSAVEAFVGEADLGRLHVGATARFIPDAQEFGRRKCRIAEIEEVNLTELEEPALASVYGGILPSRLDARGVVIPASSIHRVRLDKCSPALAPALRLRGVAHLEADGQSIFGAALRHVLAVAIREGGF